MSTKAESTEEPSATNTMAAMVYNDYGDASVLHADTIPLPQRSSGQVLIQVWASSVNPIDYRLRGGELKGLLPGGFPRVPGYDVAGVVADYDSDAPFAVGDRVVAFLDSIRGGACADYALTSVDTVVALPSKLPTDIAAAMPLAGTTALQSLRDHGKMKPGDRVLVNGASGGVGMFAVQIAKAYGCHVDAVASDENREFCLSLGADNFFDYERTDFTNSTQRWDLIFDAAGKASYCDARDVMVEGGYYVSTEPDVKGVLMTVLTWPLSKSGKTMLAKPNAADLRELINLYEAGELNVTIDGRYPMDEVADAHRHVEQGVDRGKIVLVSGSYEGSLKR